MSKNEGTGTYEQTPLKLTFDDFIFNIEHSIKKYDNDLKQLF